VQRIEWVRRRVAQLDAEAVRPPVAPAIGIASLGGQLSRALLSPVVQQPCEQHRPELDGEVWRQLLQPVQADAGERRNEIEIPDRFFHGLLSEWRVGSCAATAARSASVIS